jgi:hypothetical protein
MASVVSEVEERIDLAPDDVLDRPSVQELMVQVRNIVAMDRAGLGAGFCTSCGFISRSDRT